MPGRASADLSRMLSGVPEGAAPPRQPGRTSPTGRRTGVQTGSRLHVRGDSRPGHSVRPGQRLGTCGHVSGKVDPFYPGVSMARRPVDPRLDGGASVVHAGLRGTSSDIVELNERLRLLEEGRRPKIVLPTATPMEFDPIPALPSIQTVAAVDICCKKWLERARETIRSRGSTPGTPQRRQAPPRTPGSTRTPGTPSTPATPSNVLEGTPTSPLNLAHMID